MNISKVTLCSIFILILFAAADAQMQFISQSRSVSASNNKVSSESDASSDFVVFNESANVSWNGYSATGQQNSSLSPVEILASGSANDWGPFFAYEYYSQGSSSNFQVEFELDIPCRFSLDGMIDAYGDYGGTNYGNYLL